MQTLVVDIESVKNAKELSSLLSSITYVKRVSIVQKRKDMIVAIEEHESIKSLIVKRKNKAMAKYL